MSYIRVIAIITIIVLIGSLSTFQSIADEKNNDYLEITTLMVDFSDVKSKVDWSVLDNNIYGKKGETSHTFWNLASSGKQGVVPNKSFHSKKWYRAPKKLSYYAKDTEEKFDINVRELITWLVREAISEGLEISKEKYRTHERYPNYFWLDEPIFCVFVSGEAEHYANYPRDDAFWPHQSWTTISNSGDEKQYMVKYVLVTEEMPDLNYSAKVVAHELGHVLELADLYDYHCGGPWAADGECTYPFTYYDIMVSRHAGEGLTGLHRERFGWIEPEIISGVGSYELTVPPIVSNQKGAYLKVPIAGTKEILGIEYRTRTGIDAFWLGIPAEGVIIYKINEGTNYRNNTDWDNDGQQYCKLFNPRKTRWHNNPCYTSDDISVISPETDPSTKPEYNESTELITITVLSEDEESAKLKIDIEYKDNIWFDIPEFINTGHLHESIIYLKVENFADNDTVLKSENLVEDVYLGPFEEKMIALKFTYPEHNISDDRYEFEFLVKSNNNEFTDRLILRNIVKILDYDRNGEISVGEVKVIFDMITDPEADLTYDVDGNGKIELNDVLIAAKYVGLRY